MLLVTVLLHVSRHCIWRERQRRHHQLIRRRFAVAVAGEKPQRVLCLTHSFGCLAWRNAAFLTAAATSSAAASGVGSWLRRSPRIPAITFPAAAFADVLWRQKAFKKQTRISILYYSLKLRIVSKNPNYYTLSKTNF